MDGWRQQLLECAYADHGPDNWFVLLHGDEMWTANPRDLAGDADAYRFNLPFYFPRAGEPWDPDVHPLDQLAWSMGPGYPEFRMFRGGANVRYNRRQHFSVLPQGLRSFADSGATINHYPYRAPTVQRARAARHEETGFDPDNYRHILDRDAVFWTEDMIDGYRLKPWFAELHCNTIGVR